MTNGVALHVLSIAEAAVRNDCTGGCWFATMQADDYGWGDIGYNNGNASTPNLDEMASGKHSLKLQRYYSGGRWRQRICLWNLTIVGGIRSLRNYW